MDIVSKKLAEVLDIEDDVNKEDENTEQPLINKNPLTNQPMYSSSLITEADIAAFKNVEEELGLEDFSKIILMKTAQKAISDHDELVNIMAKVDDSKAGRLAEVAQAALSNANDSAKALMNFTVQKQKMDIEKQKLEIKSVTINNLGLGSGEDGAITGTQKEIMDKIKEMMSSDDIDDECPPLVDGV